MAQKFIVQKIKVKTDDELTDVVSQITRSEADSIVMIFSELSDLLVSPVNLQVLQDAADERDIPMVFQIFDSRAGLRNAAAIHSVFTDKAEEISNDLWDQSYKQMKERQQKLHDDLRGTSTVSISLTDEDAKLDEIPEDPKTVVPERENDSEENLAKNEFRSRIDRVLEKSKRELNESKKQVVESGGLKIAMDHDITQDLEVHEVEPDKEKTFPSIGSMDLLKGSLVKEKNRSEEKNDPSVLFDQQNILEKKDPNKGKNSPLTVLVAKLKPIFASIGKFLSGKKFKKVALMFVIPLILVTLLALYFIYKNAPRANVNIFIESRPVDVELEFTGSTNIETFDLEKLEVPVMKQTIKKERSDSTSATGTATRGQKASGVVEFFCVISETKDLPAGTVLTSTVDDLQYVLVSDVNLTCPSNSITATVEASDFGGDYNISSGIYFQINGDSDVGATSATSFTGGMVEEYTIISMDDFNRVVNPLKETSFNEAESELKKLAANGWVIIDSTISSELDGEVITDYPIGAERDLLNVTVKTTSSALYYKRSDLEAAAKDILLKAAGDQKLFENSGDLELQLGSDFTQSIDVISIEGTTIKVKVILNGAVKPQVDKDSVIDSIKGMKLDEGIEYLNDLDYISKDCEVKFLPEYFPESLRYFPTQQGKLQVKIVEVEPEEITTEEEQPADE